MAEVWVNGKSHDLQDGLNVVELLDRLGIVPRLIVVEKNGKVVYPETWKQVNIENGDVIEIASFVGGG